MSQGRNQNNDYTTRYQIRSGRVNFANYVIRREEIQQGHLLGLNLYSPTLDASIVPIIQEGATNTTVAEYNSYLGVIDASGVVPPPPAPTVPDAPTGVSAVAGNTQATVSFTAPTNDGGATITGYTVTSSPGNFTASGSSSPLTVTGLTNGTSYTFTVVATNSVGNSVASTASSAVIPYIASPGSAKLVASFYDNANLGYSTLYGTLIKLCTDSAMNVITASYARSGTFTLNKPDTDGITQISVLTETFAGTASVTQGPTTYYTNNLFITKYNSSAVPQWSAQIASDTNIGNTIYDVVCDSNNNVYALVGHGATFGGSSVISYYNADGSVYGTLTNIFGYGNFSSARYCLIKYNSSGQIQWVNSVTAGDNNNQYVFITAGYLTVDSTNNIYLSCQVQRAGGGSGPTSIKFYKSTGVSGGVVQLSFITEDSYAFGGSPSQSHRGMLIQLTSTGDYSWMARMAIPTAWGENNGGTINGNIVVDSLDNIYICLNSALQASSPTGNIYSGVSMATNPMPALTAPYYRIDLRGNSISPSLPQYYKFAGIAKFNSSGVFQGFGGAHQLLNGSVTLDLFPFIGIDNATNTPYLALTAQGFVGTNASSGAQLNKLYVDSFSANVANASNYDITVSNTFNMTLAQPQAVMAIIAFNASLVAQSIAYVDLLASNISGFGPAPGTNISVDNSGNVYLTTTIKDSATSKTIYAFDSLSGSDATFTTFGAVTTTNTNTDGLIVSYSGNLATGRWATVVKSSDNLNDSGFVSAVDTANNIYIGGTTTLDSGATTNTIGIYDYDSVSGGVVQTTLFGNMDVTGATDRAGFIIKYE